MRRVADGKRFVLFDFGQTLVDLRGLLTCLATILVARYPRLTHRSGRIAREWMRRSASSLPRREGEPFVREFLVVTDVLVGLLAEEGIALEPEAAGVLLRDAWDEFEESATFCPGISLDWLHNVRRLSAGLALVTDGDDENIERLVRKLEIGPMFDAIVTSEATRAYKPDRRIYEAALHALHAEPASSVFVSDAAIDLQGADALGMATVLLGRSSIIEAKDLPSSTVRLLDPADFPQVLKRIRKTNRPRPARR